MVKDTHYHESKRSTTQGQSWLCDSGCTDPIPQPTDSEEASFRESEFTNVSWSSIFFLLKPHVRSGLRRRPALFGSDSHQKDPRYHSMIPNTNLLRLLLRERPLIHPFDGRRSEQSSSCSQRFQSRFLVCRIADTTYLSSARSKLCCQLAELAPEYCALGLHVLGAETANPEAALRELWEPLSESSEPWELVELAWLI